MATIMNQRTKYLINKWDKRIKTVEKVNKAPLTFEKKAALASSLEACSDRIRAVEATNPGSVGQYKRYALDILTAAVPNLIAFDVMAVQPMDNRIGMINYLDYNYSAAKGAVKKGQTFNSALLKNASDPYYASGLVTNEVVTIDTSADTTYTTNVLAWGPITEEQTVDVKVSDTVTLKGTLNPSTRTVSFDAGTTTVGTSVTIVAYYYDNESVQSDLYNKEDGTQSAWGTSVPEVELKMNSIPVEARARTLRSYWAFDAQYELQKEYGQDINV